MIFEKLGQFSTLLLFTLSACTAATAPSMAASSDMCRQDLQKIEACDLIDVDQVREVLGWPELKTDVYIRMGSLDEGDEISGMCQIGIWANPKTVLDKRFSKSFKFGVHWGAESLREGLAEAEANARKAPEDLKAGEYVLTPVEGPADQNYHAARQRSLRMIYDETLSIALIDYTSDTSITEGEAWLETMRELSETITLPASCGI